MSKKLPHDFFKKLYLLILPLFAVFLFGVDDVLDVIFDKNPTFLLEDRLHFVNLYLFLSGDRCT